MAARQRDYKGVAISCVETHTSLPLRLLFRGLFIVSTSSHITLNMSISMYTTSDNDVGVRMPCSRPVSILTSPIQLGDIVSVNIPAQAAAVREGMVVGSHYDRLVSTVTYETQSSN